MARMRMPKRHYTMNLWQDIGMFIKFLLTSGSILLAIVPYAKLLKCDSVKSGTTTVSSSYMLSQCKIVSNQMEFQIPVFLYGATYIFNAVLFIGCICLNKFVWFKEHARYIGFTLFVILSLMAVTKFTLVLSLTWSGTPSFVCSNSNGQVASVDYSAACSSMTIHIPPFSNTSYVDCKDHCSMNLPESIYPLLGTIFLSFAYVGYLVIDYAYKANMQLLLEHEKKDNENKNKKKKDSSSSSSSLPLQVQLDNLHLEQGLFVEPLLGDDDDENENDEGDGGAVNVSQFEVEAQPEKMKNSFIHRVFSSAVISWLMKFGRVIQDISAGAKFVLAAVSIGVLLKPENLISCLPITSSDQRTEYMNSHLVEALCKPYTLSSLTISVFVIVIAVATLVFLIGIVVNAWGRVLKHARTIAPILIIISFLLMFVMGIVVFYTPFLNVFFDCDSAHCAKEIPAYMQHRCLDWVPAKFMDLPTDPPTCQSICTVSLNNEMWFLIPACFVAFGYIIFLLVEAVNKCEDLLGSQKVK